MHASIRWIAALALTALTWCSGAAAADLGPPVAASCPEAPEARYFPAGSTFYPPPKNAGAWDGDLFVRQWYSKHLAVMQEPSLSCGTLEAAETYRFLWLRTFDNPIAVRVARRGDDYSLEAVILDGQGGYEPARISRRVKRTLSGDQWRTVIAKLEEVQLWQMPTRGNEKLGKDGAQWIVEARRDGRYHIVDRWTGNDSPSRLESCFSTSRAWAM